MRTSDETIVKRCLKGDTNAFSLLVGRYQSAIHGLCYRMTGNFADAQDLTQESFAKAYIALARLRNPAKFAGWIHRIAANTCHTWLRDQKGSRDIPLEVVVQIDAVSLSSRLLEEHVEVEERCIPVREAIATLPKRNRLTATLYYIDGLSCAEISDSLSLSESAVKSRLHRAREQLRERLIPMAERCFSRRELSEVFLERLKRVLPGDTTREQLIETFGTPDAYLWQGETFSEDCLPGHYLMAYPDLGVNFTVGDGTVSEIRIQGNRSYAYRGKIRLGSSMEDVASCLGEPSETVVGERVDFSRDKVLHRNIKGQVGHCYIHYRELGIRMFFTDDKVATLYLCRSSMVGLEAAEKVTLVIPGETNRQQTIEILGKPTRYAWGCEEFTETCLPHGNYVMSYETGISLWMHGDMVREVRIGSNRHYCYQDRLRLGTPLEEAIGTLGEPVETIVGKPVDYHRNRVLYRDIKGQVGRCYIHYRELGIRMFFANERLRALYLCVPEPAQEHR